MKLLLALLLVFGSAPNALPFIHPGALDSKEELDFVRERIKAGDQPWTKECLSLQSSALAQREPHGLPQINSTNEEANLSGQDAAAAYAQSLLWYYTGEEGHAKRASAILRSWSKLQGFSSGTEQDRLQAGWLGACFAPAAEILRLYPGWTAEDTEALQSMFRRAFYPQLKTASHWNGNVDLTQIDALLAIAVFNEDEEAFQEGLLRLRKRLPAYIYLQSDGPLPRGIEGDGGDLAKFWSQPGCWVDGLTQESCRDNGHHAQFALGSALHAAETAWHQGVDAYAEHQERLTCALELLAAQLLSGTMGKLGNKGKTSDSRFAFWDLGYTHYHLRAGLSLPNTRQLIHEQIRVRATRHSWNLNNDILTHAELGSVATR